MEWEEDDLLYDYNSAEVMVVEEAKAAEPTLKQQEIHNMVQEYVDIVYSDIKDLNQTNIIKHIIELLDKALIAQEHLIDQQDRIWLKKELDDLLKRGIVKESASP